MGAHPHLQEQVNPISSFISACFFFFFGLSYPLLSKNFVSLSFSPFQAKPASNLPLKLILPRSQKFLKVFVVVVVFFFLIFIYLFKFISSPLLFSSEGLERQEDEPPTMVEVVI